MTKTAAKKTQNAADQATAGVISILCAARKVKTAAILGQDRANEGWNGQTQG
jgi:hypothetical protein